jgi:predicted dehydrogenase
MSKIKAAIVGCGFVAQKRHIPSFLGLKEDVSLCALCDLNQGLVTEVARRFGVKHVYSNLSEMLSKEDLDIVDICTPPNAHATVAIEAMEHGCNVLMEKPMALNVSDCDKMIDSAKKSGVKLSVVHNQKFYPPFIKAQELVNAGAIGKITGMRILSSTNRNEYMVHEGHWVHKLPGGVIGETGPHTIYMSLAFISGIKNVYVCAKKTLDYPWVLYDDYRIELEGDHINGSIYVSHAGNYTASEVDLFGTEGIIKMELESMLLTQSKLEQLEPLSVALYSLSVAGQIVKGVASNVFRVILHKPMLGHDIMIERFVNAITNEQPVPVTPEEGRETVRVMEMIVKKLA